MENESLMFQRVQSSDRLRGGGGEWGGGMEGWRR